jgi:hypothetical protein
LKNIKILFAYLSFFYKEYFLINGKIVKIIVKAIKECTSNESLQK